jgi:predicted amidohydrolase
VLAEKNEVAGRFDEIRQRMLQWSKQVQAVVLGSTVYAAEDLYYNRMIIAFPDGQCQYYDKRHCFRMGGENEHFSSGGRRVVFDYAGAKIAVFICYDLRFPVWCRNVDGYDIAVYIANWPAARREVWQMLLKARAIENQAYVAGVNCVGTDLNGIVYAGDSMGVNARGEVMKQAPAFQEATLWLECDRGVLQDFRHKFAVLEDRDSFVVEI